MDKAIITVLLIIAGVTCVAVLFGSVYPAITRGSDAVVSMSAQAGDRIKSHVSIVHVVSEYDPNDGVDSWNDMNSSGTFDIYVWAKNVGTSRILGVEGCDVFFGEEGDFKRITHEDFAGAVKPFWQDTLEDSATEWGPGTTMKLTVVYSDNYAGSGLSADTTHLLKLIIPNGISDEVYFSW